MSQRATLIGRDRETAAIGAAVARLGSGRGNRFGWLAISGEAGIGKSRLIDELADLADGRGYLVLRGQGSELERDIPFNAVIDALDDYLGAVDPDQLRTLGAARLEELASVFPALAPAGRAVRSGDSELDRWQAYRAVRRLLELLAARRPLVLALDDLHWADTASIELIAHLLRRPPKAAVLLVLAYRPRQAPDALLAALAASGATTADQPGTDATDAAGTRLELGALSPADADALLGPSVSPATRARWYRESGGNPFYLEQLARAARTRRASAARPAERIAGLTPAQLAGDDPPPTLPPGLTPPGWDIGDDDAGDGAELADRVPPAIAAAVGAEIAALPAAARTLAQGAAVAGEVFDPDLAAAAAGFGETEDGTTVLDAIDALVRADVIRTTEMPRRFAFRHPIVRHAVYVSAGPGWRLAAHARAAEALAAHGASATARAHHVERAARPGDEAAISLLTEAAEANRLRAPAAAARWYAAALRLLPSPAAPTAATATTEGGLDLRRLSLLSRLAGALDASYQPERARGVLDEILARLPRSLAEQRAQVIALRSAVDHMLGRHGEARALVLDAMAAADPSSREGCLLRIQLAIDHFYTAEYEGMRRWQQEAHRLVGRLGDPALFAVSAGLLAGAEYMTSGMAAAASPLTVAGHQYDLLTDDQVLPHVLMLGWLGWTEIYMERFTDAARHLERADAIARRTGRGAASVMMSVGRATLAGWRGRVGEAARLAEDAVESCLLAPHLPFLSWALAIRCSTSTLSGELADALRFGAQAVRAARPETDTISVLAGSHYAEALVEAGEPVRAIEELLSAAGGPSLRRIETAYHPYWCELLTRAELARVGETAGAGAGADGADASLTEVVAAADRWACRAEETAAGAGGSLPGRLASALRARAAVDLARGDAKAAAERALESAAAADQAELVIESGRSRTLAGRALATLGDTAAAVAELRRAEARLRAAGANRPGDEAARLLRQLGQRVARGGRPAGRASEPGQDGAAARLSARERQIAQLVAAGQTNKQIAAQLFVSEKTVESHLTKVLAKLGVPSRAAVGAALRD